MNKETDLKMDRKSRRSSLLKRRSSQHPKSLTSVGLDYLPAPESTPEDKFVDLQVACFKATAQSIAQCSSKLKNLHHQLIVRGDEASEDFRLELLNPKKWENVQIGRIDEPQYRKIDAYIKKLENESQEWNDEVKNERAECERVKRKVEERVKRRISDTKTTSPELNYVELNETIIQSSTDIKILEKFLRHKLREFEKVRDLLKRKNDEKFEKLVKLATLEICND